MATAAGASVAAPSRYIDHMDQPATATISAACDRAVARQLRRQALGDRAPPLPLLDDELLEGHDKPPEAAASGSVAIAFLMMGHRNFAHVTIPRLIRVLWSSAHLFLVHLDARTNITSVDGLRRQLAVHPNVRFLRTQRAVGWGAFSMVELLLTALTASLNASPSLDFFINLSDVDVALRTGRELGHFLAGFRGRSFVSIKYPEADAMRYHAHAHMRTSTWLECDGEGFVIVNKTAGGFFGGDGRRCCYARSGPIVYATLPIERPPPPADTPFYHGSQWVMLARPAVEFLARDPRAAALARHAALTYMADESFVQTALMASAHRRALINHNLRYIDWPHGYGDPNAYWQAAGARHVSGPMVLTAARFETVARSGAVFARKVDLEEESGAAFVRRWDQWMAAKLALEAAAEAAAEATAEAADGTPGSTEHELARGAAGGMAGGAAGGMAGGAMATARELVGAVGQPQIAASLLAEDPSLAACTPPLTQAERHELSRRVAAGGLSEDEAARMRQLASPRAVHFGHEDLMAKQFEQGRPPATSPPVAAPLEAKAHELVRLRGVPEPLPLHTATANWERRQASELAASQEMRSSASDDSSPAAPLGLARMHFTDGSSCSCDAWCGRSLHNECCEHAGWGDACRWAD